MKIDLVQVTTHTIVVGGFGRLIVSGFDADNMFGGKYHVEDVILLDNPELRTFDGTATFWFDFIPKLAVAANVDEDQLKYCLAFTNVMSKIDLADD